MEPGSGLTALEEAGSPDGQRQDAAQGSWAGAPRPRGDACPPRLQRVFEGGRARADVWLLETSVLQGVPPDGSRVVEPPEAV